MEDVLLTYFEQVVSFCAIIFSITNSIQLFCEHSSLNSANFIDSFFRVNSWKFNPNPKIFTSVTCDFCDKFLDCSVYNYIIAWSKAERDESPVWKCWACWTWLKFRKGQGGSGFDFFSRSRQSCDEWNLSKMSIRRFVFESVFFFIYLERSVSAWSCIGLIRKLCPCPKLSLIYSFNQRQLARVVDKQGSQFIISVEVWSLFIYCVHVQIFSLLQQEAKNTENEKRNGNVEK